MISPDLLRIHDLHICLGSRALVRGISLNVRPGEILGLVGASGSGKSLTALAVLDLLPPKMSRSGTVRLRGAVLTEATPAQMQAIRGRDIGMVFQEPMTALNPLLRIGDQVAETLRLHRRATKAEAMRLARAALDGVGLTGEQGALDKFPYELSGGQRQRVAIAMATVMTPALLIADEPTTALDVLTQAQVLTLLETTVRRASMGLLLITHDLAVIAQITDRVAVMQQGLIVEQGETQALLRHPQHAYTRALLKAATLQPKRPRAAERGAPAAGSIDAATPVLEVLNVVRRYPRPRRSLWRAEPAGVAVNGVSLRIYAGETVGLVGESGAGKSSLLRAVLALERPQAGQVNLLGEQFSNARGARLRRLRRAIQLVSQDPYASFDPRWSVERLIAEPFHLLESPPTTMQRRDRVLRALEQVGLSPSDARRHPHEFSGGQRQRIAVARALIIEPKVIALDEAVSALDVLVRDQILGLLADLAVRLKLAYLFVSHDLQVVRSIADRVYVMQHGRIVEEGTTEAVFSAPREPYTRALVAAVPKLNQS